MKCNLAYSNLYTDGSAANRIHTATECDWSTYNSADLAGALRGINIDVDAILDGARSNSLTDVQGNLIPQGRVISELQTLSSDVLKILDAVEGILSTGAWKDKRDVVEVHGEVISNKGELHLLNSKVAQLVHITGQLQNGQ
jgi:hypothetical protein